MEIKIDTPQQVNLKRMGDTYYMWAKLSDVGLIELPVTFVGIFPKKEVKFKLDRIETNYKRIYKSLDRQYKITLLNL